MPADSHLDPSIKAYVNDPGIARDYDFYFYMHPLFSYDEEFLRETVMPGARVLDLGVGTGRHALSLAKQGCMVAGLDLSRHMLDVAREKTAALRPFVSLVQADMMRLPFAASAGFDAILMMFSTLGLISGAENRQALLVSLKQLLRPEGLIILHLHNNNYRYSPHRGALNALRDKTLTMTGRLEPGDHIVHNYRGVVDLRLHSFTIAEMTSIVGNAGLQLQQVQGINDHRDGPCESEDIDTKANGFFVIARRARE